MKISSSLEEIILYFEGVEDLNKIRDQADKVVFDIFIRLILNKEIDITIPKYNLKLIRIGNEDITEFQINDRIAFRDELRIERMFGVKGFLEEILSDDKLVTDSNELLYLKLLSIVKNPDRVVKFMVLYDFLMEIASKNKSQKVQKNVCDFIRENGFDRGMNSIGFRTTRRENYSFEEDDFTYFRNEIAHAEFQNDFEKYGSLSSSISNALINKLLEVINFGIQNLE